MPLIVILLVSSFSLFALAGANGEQSIYLRVNPTYVSIRAGDNYTASIDVAIANANDTIILSYSNATSFGNVALEFIPSNASLRAGENFTSVIQIVSSAAAREGNYSFRISAFTLRSGVTSSTSLDVTITTATDLIASGLTVYPSSPQEGKEVTFDALVKNAGPTTVSNIETQFFLDEQNIKNYTIPSIPVGQTLSVSAIWSHATKGNHTIGFSVDPHDLIEEISNLNNQIQKDFPVNASYFTVTIQINGLKHGNTSVYVNGTLEALSAGTWSKAFEVGQTVTIHLDQNVSVSQNLIYSTKDDYWPGISGSTVINVHYFPVYRITINSIPGNIVEIPGSGWYSTGNGLTLVAPELQFVSNGTQLRFDHWESGQERLSTFNTILFTVTEPSSITAVYSYYYQVSINSTYGNLGLQSASGNCDGDWCKNGTDVVWQLSIVEQNAEGILGKMGFKLTPNETSSELVITHPVKLVIRWEINLLASFIPVILVLIALLSAVVGCVGWFLKRKKDKTKTIVTLTAVPYHSRVRNHKLTKASSVNVAISLPPRNEWSTRFFCVLNLIWV